MRAIDVVVVVVTRMKVVVMINRDHGIFRALCEVLYWIIW